ncbi:hypothetical protein PFLUV_G00231710 [Perca fluviatilis]|uniref:Uncharacterized protein n=1 Tax=Perca fluviatilis TaxID=8168 RepID=A0A6A5E2S1_PERFL|nr:hypothetical protein PFLUV_G00231710 [Perca fluviatilis]
MVERSSKFLLIVVGSVCFMLILYQDLERTIDFQIKGEDVIVFCTSRRPGDYLRQAPGPECTSGGPLRLQTGPEEVYLLPAEPQGDLALLPVLHRLERGLHAERTELTNCVPGVLNKKENKQKNLRYNCQMFGLGLV